MLGVSVETFDSQRLLNKADHFKPIPLPVQAEYSEGLELARAGFIGDDKLNVFLSQNLFVTE